MTRFLTLLTAYLTRGKTTAPTSTLTMEPVRTPEPDGMRVARRNNQRTRAAAAAAAPSALDRLDGHFHDARALVDSGRGRHAVDSGTRLIERVPAAIAPAPPLAASPDVTPVQLEEALLRQVLTHITTYPRVWDQHRWWHSDECGTTGCIAGWTVYFGRPDAYVDSVTGDVHAGPFDPPAGRRVGTVPTVARDALGLSGMQVALLFAPENDLRTLWTLAEKWTSGRIQAPAELPDGS